MNLNLKLEFLNLGLDLDEDGKVGGVVERGVSGGGGAGDAPGAAWGRPHSCRGGPMRRVDYRNVCGTARGHGNYAN